jgi:hypothetical protein
MCYFSRFLIVGNGTIIIISSSSSIIIIIIIIIDSAVGIATGYGLDDQEGREFESR